MAGFRINTENEAKRVRLDKGVRKKKNQDITVKAREVPL